MVETTGGMSESFILGLIASLGGLISLIFTSLRKSRSACYNDWQCSSCSANPNVSFGDTRLN